MTRGPGNVVWTGPLSRPPLAPPPIGPIAFLDGARHPDPKLTPTAGPAKTAPRGEMLHHQVPLRAQGLAVITLPMLADLAVATPAYVLIGAFADCARHRT